MKILRGHFAEYSVKKKGKPRRMGKYKSWENAVDEKRKTINCLECGRKFKHINWIHLKNKHQMTPDEYREKHKICYTDGLTSEYTKKLRSTLVLERIKNGQAHFTSESVKKFKSQGLMGSFRRSPSEVVRRQPINKEELNRKHSLLMKDRFKNDPLTRQKVLETLEKARKNHLGCLTCRHPKRHDIERLIRTGLADEKVSQWLGELSRSAIQNHRTNCMGLKVLDGLRRRSNRKEGACVVCGKKFIYYSYDRERYGVKNYERKYCRNLCKGKGMTLCP